jgi:hypothetical protein
MSPDQSEGGAVEGPGDDFVGDTKGPQPLSKLVGGLAAERAGQDVLSESRSVADSTGDPQGEDPRLPRSRTGEHAEHRIGRADGLELVGSDPPRERSPRDRSPVRHAVTKRAVTERAVTERAGATVSGSASHLRELSGLARKFGVGTV